MPIYNKLVRDRIPEIIAQSGKTYESYILEDRAYKESIVAKVSEELAEYVAAPSDELAVEELADLLELVNAFASLHGASLADVERVRAEKAEKRGGFAEKIFLVEVHDE